MKQQREKFATQVDSSILDEIRKLARKEGRQIQSLVDEAFADLISKREQTSPRSHVMDEYMKSHGAYSNLYKKLAE